MFKYNLASDLISGTAMADIIDPITVARHISTVIHHLVKLFNTVV